MSQATNSCQQNISEVIMLKSLLVITTIITLSSCVAKKNRAVTDDSQMQVVEDTNQTRQPYQVVDNENQAIELNSAEQQRVEEVEVKDRIFFGYDSFTLNDESKKILNTQAEWLRSDLNINITIEGHADERGTREYNIALGEKRAKSVKDYLVSNGVTANRIKIVSFGKERPAFFGATEEIFNKNRRAVTVVN